MPDNRALGPKFGQLFPRVRAALAEVDANAAVATLRSGQPLRLRVDGQQVELAAGDVVITPQPKSGFAVRAEGEYVVALDTAVTPALRAEGLAREFVRRVQDLRKTAGLDIADRIATHYAASETLAAAVAAHANYIQAETLSVRLERGALPEGAASAEDEFDGETLTLGLVKAPVDEGRKTKAGPGKSKARAVKPQAKAKAVKAKRPAAKPEAKPKTKARPNGKAGRSRPGPKPKAQKPKATKAKTRRK
jgi:isoleucyl-tRNA synthetase